MTLWKKLQEMGAALVMLLVGGTVIAMIWRYQTLEYHLLPTNGGPWNTQGPPLRKENPPLPVRK